MSFFQSYSGPYFPILRLNWERYSLSLRIQSECGKIRTRTLFTHCLTVVSKRSKVATINYFTETIHHNYYHHIFSGKPWSFDSFIWCYPDVRYSSYHFRFSNECRETIDVIHFLLKSLEFLGWWANLMIG